MVFEEMKFGQCQICGKPITQGGFYRAPSGNLRHIECVNELITELIILKRDNLIIKLYSVYLELTDVYKDDPDKIHEYDLDLMFKLMNHPAVQDRLKDI